MCYIGVTEEKIEKEGKMRFSIFIFIYTIHLANMKVNTKFENTGSNRNREICYRNFHWRERKKKTNKGTDKQYVAVLLLHNTTKHYQALYQRILTQVVAEKSVTEKYPYALYKSERREKMKKMKKEGKMSILISIYTVHLPS